MISIEAISSSTLAARKQMTGDASVWRLKRNHTSTECNSGSEDINGCAHVRSNAIERRYTARTTNDHRVRVSTMSTKQTDPEDDRRYHPLIQPIKPASTIDICDSKMDDIKGISLSIKGVRNECQGVPGSKRRVIKQPGMTKSQNDET